MLMTRTLDDVISSKNREIIANMVDWSKHVDCEDDSNVKLRGRPKKDEHKNYKKSGTIVVGDVGWERRTSSTRSPYYLDIP